jgi:lysophospholipid acyltransferase (LPLAT)-like uncharacterized protein
MKIRKPFLGSLWNTFRRKYFPPLLAVAVKKTLQLILFTCKVEAKNIEGFSRTASKERCILMLWHAQMLLIPHFGTKYAPQYTYTAVISKSQDGELLAALARKYSNATTIRIAHTSRFQAVRDIIAHLKQDYVILMAPDGPRGPRHVVKPGIVLAARAANARIIPFSWTCNRYWQLKSWDKLMIPKPFSKIMIRAGDALSLDSDGDIAEQQLMLQNALSEQSLALS